MKSIRLLTPAGSGAIAVLEVQGDGTWEAVRQLFQPVNQKSLPAEPILHRTWFGRLGEGIGDEVILAVKQVEPTPTIEIHCHGGRRVVRWIIEQFEQLGFIESVDKTPGNNAWELLQRAPTKRTASILLDQANGAFDRAVAKANWQRLAALIPVGRHLIDPWKVVIAGPPNVGKSSLINALAGYQRSIVSPIAGTTRDVVTTQVAFDGWPVELSDTAGLRQTGEELEAEGIERARQRMLEADLVVWVYDGEAEEPSGPDGRADLCVINKTDALPGWDWMTKPEALRISAATGVGISELIAAIVVKLVPVVPEPGEGVPYTAELADAVLKAFQTPVDRI